jgi:hypothetical protein
VKKESFLRALTLWSEYCGGTMSRKTLDTTVYDSTYVISMIRWMEKHTEQVTPHVPPA